MGLFALVGLFSFMGLFLFVGLFLFMGLHVFMRELAFIGLFALVGLWVHGSQRAGRRRPTNHAPEVARVPPWRGTPQVQPSRPLGSALGRGAVR